MATMTIKATLVGLVAALSFSVSALAASLPAGSVVVLSLVPPGVALPSVDWELQKNGVPLRSGNNDIYEGVFLALITSVPPGTGYQVTLDARSTEYHCYGASADAGVRVQPLIPTPLYIEMVCVSDAMSVTTGENDSCVVRADRTVQCWGYNGFGNLGDGTMTSSRFPVTVSGLTEVTALSAGTYQTCAVRESGELDCFGASPALLGDGNNWSESTVPAPVVSVTNAVGVSAGFVHRCVVLADGRVQCWGMNQFGQVGDGSGLEEVSSPSTVTGITNAIAVAAARVHSCALLADGTMQCWGYNQFGKLGDHTDTQRNTPVTVIDITDAVGMALGDGHSCALLADGTVWCWGWNNYGQLGNDSTMDSYVPVMASGVTNAVAISAGWYGTCALLADGGVRCWGYNGQGQLGDGTLIDSGVPVVVSGIADAVSMSTSREHACAALRSGSVRCWGFNADGQLGNGTTTDSAVPVTVVGY